MATNADTMTDLWSRAVEIAELAKLLEFSLDGPDVPAGSDYLVNIIREKLGALSGEIGKAQNEQMARPDRVAA